jgi:isopropylmalate/homocitrate/citramalate synthase
MDLPPRIRIIEVGPRDGLQNEKEIVSVADKVAFIDALSQSGVAEIEVSSFVSPKWVPQLGDAAEVLAKIARRSGVVYSALVPNEKGLESALAASVRKIAVFTAASETFSRKNTNATIAETIERFRPVVKRAKEAGLAIRGYISCVVQCPYEGPIEPRKVREVAAMLLEIGVDEIDLGETIGVAGPVDIDRLYEGLHDLLLPQRTTLHLHDTRGTALACAYRAMQLGVTSFDASCGGLGGCPYAPGAAGNLATEDLVYLAQRCGIKTGVELPQLFAAGRIIEAAVGRSLRGRVFDADGRVADDGESMLRTVRAACR